MFHIGQKVICVDTRSPVIRGTQTDIKRLAEGAQYIVTNTRIDPRTGIPAIQVDAIPEKYIWAQARRFRPLIEHKTDISIFTAMLKPKQKRRSLTSAIR